jgi:ACS family sodium-dependent inorganic phosphate cotransporter
MVETCPSKDHEDKLPIVIVHNHLHDNKTSSLHSDHIAIIMTGKTYEWDQSMQGLILGSFFYAYIIFQMPAGIVAEKYGGRWVIALCLFGSAVVSLITPVITDLHVGVLIFARFVMGGCQAGMFPAAFGVLCKWMPLKERSSAFALLHVGAKIGASLPLFCSGILIGNYGWPSMFYLPGILATVVFVAFTLFVRSSPEEHPFISVEELMHIKEDSSNDNQDNNNESNNSFPSSSAESEKKSVMPSIPWIKIITNQHVMTVAFFQFACFFILTTFFSLLPKYLNEVIHVDISTNGRINGILNSLSLITLTTTGFISEVIIQKGWLTRTQTRKSFSLLSGLATGICMFLIPSAGCNESTLQIIVYSASILSGFMNGSDTPLASEMSSNFPAALFALLNMISTSTGFIAPAFAGAILQGMQDDPVKAWSIIFYFCGSLAVVATALFLMFASAERQPFDYIEKTTEFNEMETRRCSCPE